MAMIPGCARLPQQQLQPVPAETERERLAREAREIAAALAAAAAGRTVSLEAVQAWVDSWETEHELPKPRSGN